MFQYTTKLEVNIRRGKMAPTDMHNLSTFLIKSKIPAIVIDPEFIDPMMVERSKFNGQYKIIVAVDFDNGRRYGMEKLKYLPKNTFQTNGIEILLTPGRNDKESLNELKVISEWGKMFNPLLEIRWVFGFRTRARDLIANFMPYLKNVPGTFLRTDPNCEIPKISVEEHESDVAYLKEHSSTPIKISGNVTLEIMNAIKVARYDVTIGQAKKIVKAIEDENKKPQGEKNMDKAIKEITDEEDAKVLSSLKKEIKPEIKEKPKVNKKNRSYKTSITRF
jgi:hypothetical protein